MALLVGLKAHGPWSSQPLKRRAQVGQVDLFWTNIGKKLLTWGFKITVKVYGIGFLVELVGLVRYYMQIKGNFDLTVFSTGVTIPTTLREIGPRLVAPRSLLVYFS